jgi:hypothetical protein
MRIFRKRQRGQVIVMVTLCLFALCGILGLAVDLGWMFYIRKTAQAAADAAAIAAVKRVMDSAVTLADYSCGPLATCAATPVDCPGASGNLDSACLYAAQNGFSPAANPRQRVTVQASDRNTPPTVAGCAPQVYHPPTAPCVDTYYWVTVRVSQQVPQLFSAVLGNYMGMSAARATAAVARAELIGSLILLNRQNDPWVDSGNIVLGNNLRLYGTPTIHVPGGIFLSSNTSEAGWIQGQGAVDSPSGTWIRTGGGIGGSGAGNWQIPPENRSDGPFFYDPMRSKNGQPPIHPTTNYIPVPIVSNKATLSSSHPSCTGGICPPGNYYAAEVPKGCTDPSCMIPTGDPIEIGGNVTFGGPFGTYVFFGGLTIGQSTVEFGPGEYVFAGVKDPSRSSVLDTDNKALLLGGTGENADAGRILIFTDSRYEGRLDATKAGIPNFAQSLWPSQELSFGNASIKSGNNADSHVELYGLNKLHQDVIDAGLQEWAPVVVWQDQLNSNVKYATDEFGHSTGQIDTSCLANSLDSPCMNPYSPYRQLEIWATPFAKYGGVIYQPRGSWTWLQASGDYEGPLQIISGALKTTGSGNLTLTGPMIPTTIWVAALVE